MCYTTVISLTNITLTNRTTNISCEYSMNNNEGYRYIMTSENANANDCGHNSPACVLRFALIAIDIIFTITNSFVQR